MDKQETPTLVTQVCHHNGVVYEFLSAGMKAHWNRRVSYAVVRAGSRELEKVLEAIPAIQLAMKSW